MKRIAFFGPLPPLTTGISDYDEELLPLLRQDFEIDVFLQNAPLNNEGFSHADFFSKHDRNPYDLTLYQMGNSPFHEYMYGYLFQNPGAVVFHDYCLLHSRSEMLLKKKLFNEYRAELEAVYPHQADQIANTIISSAAGDLLFYQFPLFQLVLRSSIAAAAHTDFAVKQLAISGTPVIKVPHLEYKRLAVDRDPVPGKFVIATFGYVTGAKRISMLLEAFAQVSAKHPKAVCVIVGDVEDHTGLLRQMEAMKLTDRVMVTKRLPITEFLTWMGRADVIVNLRYPSAGEMSGTLIRALGSAKPVIISRLPELQEVSENAVLRVRPDREKFDLENSLLQLIENEELRKTLSANARDYISKHHSPELVRAQYRRLIETAIERKSQYRAIELPAHLRSNKEILLDYLQKSSMKNAPTAFAQISNQSDFPL